MYLGGYLKADGVQWYQELIGTMRRAVEIVRIEILLELLLIPTHLELPRDGYLEQAPYIFGYLKIPKKITLMFSTQE